MNFNNLFLFSIRPAAAKIKRMDMKETKPPSGLSIVIPVYRESKKVCADIDAAAAFLGQIGQGEILIVDDGSPDDTAEVAERHAAQLSAAVQVLRLPRHRGKGAAVRTGVLQSCGRLVMFADSGGCIPFEEAIAGIVLIEQGLCRLAHGRRTRIRRKQSLYRRACSRLFNHGLIGDLKYKLGLTDTQCGFKVYDGDTARQLYAQSTIDGFMFDLEIILLAARNGAAIREFPVTWSSDPDSRLQPLRQSIGILKDILRLRLRFADIFKKTRKGSSTQ